MENQGHSRQGAEKAGGMSIEKQRKQREKSAFFFFNFQNRLLKSTSKMTVLKAKFFDLKS